MPDDRVCPVQIRYGFNKPIVFYLIVRVSSSFIVDIKRKPTIRIVLTILWKTWRITSITISASLPHVTKVHAILICAEAISNKSTLGCNRKINAGTTRPSVISIWSCFNDVRWEDDQGTKQNTKSSCSHFVTLNL